MLAIVDSADTDIQATTTSAEATTTSAEAPQVKVHPAMANAVPVIARTFAAVALPRERSARPDVWRTFTLYGSPVLLDGLTALIDAVSPSCEPPYPSVQLTCASSVQFSRASNQVVACPAVVKTERGRGPEARLANAILATSASIENLVTMQPSRTATPPRDLVDTLYSNRYHLLLRSQAAAARATGGSASGAVPKFQPKRRQPLSTPDRDSPSKVARRDSMLSPHDKSPSVLRPDAEGRARSPSNTLTPNPLAGSPPLCIDVASVSAASTLAVPVTSSPVPNAQKAPSPPVTRVLLGSPSSAQPRGRRQGGRSNAGLLAPRQPGSTHVQVAEAGAAETGAHPAVASLPFWELRTADQATQGATPRAEQRAAPPSVVAASSLDPSQRIVEQDAPGYNELVNSGNLSQWLLANSEAKEPCWSTNGLALPELSSIRGPLWPVERAETYDRVLVSAADPVESADPLKSRALSVCPIQQLGVSLMRSRPCKRRELKPQDRQQEDEGSGTFLEDWLYRINTLADRFVVSVFRSTENYMSSVYATDLVWGWAQRCVTIPTSFPVRIAINGLTGQRPNRRLLDPTLSYGHFVVYRPTAHQVIPSLVRANDYLRVS